MSDGPRALAAVVRHGRRHLGRAGLALALGLGALAAGLGLLATSGYLISKAALQPPILSLTVAIVGVRFFGITRAVCRYLERLVAHDVAFRLLADLRVLVYRRLMPLAPGRFRTGDVLSRFVGDVDSLQHLFVRGLAPPVVSLGAVALAVCVALLILPGAAVVLAVALLVAGGAVPFVGRLASRGLAARRGPAQAELTMELTELLRGGPELVAYGATDAPRARVRDADRRLTRIARRDAVGSGLTGALMTLISTAAAAAVVAIAAAAVHDGSLDGVCLGALVLLALSSFEAVAPLPAAAQHLARAAAAARRIEEITVAAPVVTDLHAPRPLEAVRSVVVEGARFRYEDAGPWVLDGVDLRVEPGRRVALVGPSGSGKSTLARLLVRYFDPDEGRISLNGFDAREFARADVRRHIVLASEDAHLFATSIRENVRLARPSADDDEIEPALVRAGASSWVRSLPDGLDTFVGDGGALVSGGQRQRIALARALLMRAPVLVLDEPTAHLDAAAADAFLRDALAATHGLGLLLITHRLVGLESFDEIVVLDRGRVVERGTERELLRRDGVYAELRRLPARPAPPRRRSG